MISAEKILKLEQHFIRKETTAPYSHIILPGEKKVMFSAPHCVTHWREEKNKTGEYLTGVLATLLNEQWGYPAIIKTKFEKNDANYDAEHPYKEDLLDFILKNNIHCLIDLHIMAAFRKPEIEIGTGRGKNVHGKSAWPLLLKEKFAENGIDPIVIDEHFTGGYKHTVSSTIARKANIPCMQLEFNWRILDLEGDQPKINFILQSLHAFINEIDKGDSYV